MQAARSDPDPPAEARLQSIDALLSAVAQELEGPSHAFLFAGEFLRLDLPVFRDGAKKMKWGKAAYQDWAFEATLLRFARADEPARLIVVLGQGAEPRIKGWIIGHSKSSFWALPMPQERAMSMLAHVRVQAS